MRGMRAAASRSIHREVGVAAERRGPGFWLRGAEAMPAIRGRDEHQNLEPALRFLQSHAAELAQARGAVHGSAPNQVGSDPAMAGGLSELLFCSTADAGRGSIDAGRGSMRVISHTEISG